MLCPYCRTPLTELTPECPECRLNIKRAANLLGPVPRIEIDVTDHTEALDSRERHRIRCRIDQVQQRFPQIRLQVLCQSFPTEHPFSLYVFWVFNLGDIGTSTERGGDNHTILLTLDPISKNSALSVGYGLEPFLSDLALDHLLEMAEPAWQEKHWYKGISIVIDGLETLLESAVLEARIAFDLPSPENSRVAGDY